MKTSEEILELIEELYKIVDFYDDGKISINKVIKKLSEDEEDSLDVLEEFYNYHIKFIKRDGEHKSDFQIVDYEFDIYFPNGTKVRYYCNRDLSSGWHNSEDNLNNKTLSKKANYKGEKDIKLPKRRERKIIVEKVEVKEVLIPKEDEVLLFDRLYKVHKQYEKVKYIGPKSKSNNTVEPFDIDLKLNTNQIIYDVKFLDNVTLYKPKKNMEHYQFSVINKDFFKPI